MMQGSRRWFGPAAALVVQLAVGGYALAGPPPDEELRATMEQMMLHRLKTVLRLSSEQTKRVMPRFEKLLNARRVFAHERRAARSHLRAVMIDETADEAAVEKALRDLETIERRFHDQQLGVRDTINGELSPRQQAQLRFFEENFRRKMQQRLREAAAQRRRARGEAGPGRRRDRARPGQDPFESDFMEPDE